jgi:hypothetical protein
MKSESYFSAVETAITKYFSAYRPAPVDEEKDHIVSVAASILMLRDGIQSGGGFAQAVINNDLEGALNRADSTCRNYLDFLVYCKKYAFVKS